MDIIILISLIIVAISGLFGLVKQMQMLQQNSYFPSRYFKWVKTEYYIKFFLELTLSAGLIVSIKEDTGITVFILSSVILIIRILSAVYSQKKSIKKLVFTGRVKRFFATAIILNTIFILLYALFSENIVGQIGYMFIAVLSFTSPLLCFAVRFITAPIDKAINKWYISDATRILRGYKNLTVIGVTGSYGKTTTKFIIERILSEKYNVVATPQSFNTPLGVVRTIREKLKPETQIFICEMGAKNVGDIKEICDIVNPDIGIITSVGPQHLETFKSVDNVFKTKFELADAVLKKGGKVFVNGDSKEIINRINKSLYTVYGTGDFNAVASDISYGKNGSEFTVNFDEEKLKLTSRLLGLHSIINITGASAIALKLGVKANDIRFAAASLKSTEHRLELKPYTNGSLLIDDAYNSNPEGCLEAVNVLASFDGMKKVIVTPGLIELGDKEYECNYTLGTEAAKKCDVIILVGLTRSKPIRDGVEAQGFDQNNLHTVASFKDAMKIYSGLSDKNTVVLFENDLPDNYLK